tara:strand:+ start:1084 stop:1500 length:417 start_codon:yes stop_codon:yes gene_type:complete
MAVSAALTEEFRKRVVNLELSTENVMTILEFAMEAVEVVGLRGDEKRAAAIVLLRDLVEAVARDDTTRDSLLKLIDSGIVGNTIDIIIAASKGKFALNSAVNVTTALVEAVVDGVEGKRCGCLSRLFSRRRERAARRP